MIAETMYRLTFNGEEMDAMYEVCMSALEADLLEGMPKAFAMAIVESYNEAADEADEQETQETYQ